MQNQRVNNIALTNFQVKHGANLLATLQTSCSISDGSTRFISSHSSTNHQPVSIAPFVVQQKVSNQGLKQISSHETRLQSTQPFHGGQKKTLIFQNSGVSPVQPNTAIVTNINSLTNTAPNSDNKTYTTSLVLNGRTGNAFAQNVRTISTNAFVPLNQLIVSESQYPLVLKPSTQIISKEQKPVPITASSQTNTKSSDSVVSMKVLQPLKPKIEAASFDWEEYLKLTSQTAAPLKCFKHVLSSQCTGFLPGMKLEVDNTTVPNTYWVATVIETRGKTLILRYDGFGNDGSEDFIVNIKTGNLHPIGWCAQNAKILQPPERIKNQHENWAEFLVETLIGARTVPSHLLMPPNKGKTLTELIEKGMLLEIQDAQHPQHVWIAHVEKNVGGRLLLRYEGMTDEDSRQDFWLFYLNIRLHPLGWGKEHGLTMKPPDHIRKKYSTGEQWALKLSRSLKGITERELVSSFVFQDQVKLREHGIKEPGKLAVLDPVYPTKVRPATVVNIVNKNFFLAQLDQTEKSCMNHAFLCHSSSSGIFSIEWCKRHKIPITLANGETVPNFNWDYYLQKAGIAELPASCFETYGNHNFKSGMMLEAGNPFNLQEICLARVIAVHGSIIRLQLNNALECFVPVNCHDIFPVGWCKANKYPLSSIKMWSPMSEKLNLKPAAIKTIQPQHVKPTGSMAPVKADDETKLIKKSTTDTATDKLINFVNPKQNSDLWCPAIYFNCSCNIGLSLNSFNLTKVPRKVGPGNIILVLKEVLSLLVGAANNPIKVLKEFESISTNGNGYQECDLKAKYNGKKYKTTVTITDNCTCVPTYLKSILSVLKCCPNLLTINQPLTNCPLNCKQILTEQTKSNRHNIILARKKHLQKMRMAKVIKRRFQKNNILNGFVLPKRDHSSDNSSIISFPQVCDKSLTSNPFNWTVDEVVEFVKSSECKVLASIFKQQEIDGQALLMLTLPVVQECMELKLGPALKLCRVIENAKLEFYKNYAN